MRAAVIGATGLIGNELVQQLSQDSFYSAITALVRKPGNFHAPSIQEVVVDFSNDTSLKQHLHVDVLFICMGTTIKKAGSKAAFEQADLTIPLRCASLAHELGCTQLVVISSVGARTESNNFYLQVKGRLEQSLTHLQCKSLHIFQPSLLMGPRKELRIGEKIASYLVPLTDLFCKGALQQYHSMPYRTLAAAMREAPKQNHSRLARYTYLSILQLAQQHKVSSAKI